MLHDMLIQDHLNISSIRRTYIPHNPSRHVSARLWTKGELNSGELKMRLSSWHCPADSTRPELKITCQPRRPRHSHLEPIKARSEPSGRVLDALLDAPMS
jgi:hypothetical protein